MQYRVRWKNYSSSDDTWEPEAHLEDCSEVLLAYERSLAEKKLKRDASMVRVLRCIPEQPKTFVHIEPFKV